MVPFTTDVSYLMIPQYKKYDKFVCNHLDGMFSFVLLDESVTPSRVIAARDPIGITTLYQGWSSERPGAVFFASELKALTDECDNIISFPPGHVYDSRDKSTMRYFQPSWWDGDSDEPNVSIPTNPANLTLLRQTLEAAVRKRLMSEVPYGVLLSGGLDSSLIAAIAARETEKVAQVQYEMRKKPFQSGPPSPKSDGDGIGEGTCSFRSMTILLMPGQQYLRLGRDCIHSPLVWKTLRTSSRPGWPPIILVPCTMSMFLRFKKV